MSIYKNLPFNIKVEFRPPNYYPPMPNVTSYVLFGDLDNIPYGKMSTTIWFNAHFLDYKFIPNVFKMHWLIGKIRITKQTVCFPQKYVFQTYDDFSYTSLDFLENITTENYWERMEIAHLVLRAYGV